MQINVFESSDYRDFLAMKIAANAHNRGYKGRLAKGANCHHTFLSQVLHSSVHLTPDHAAGLSEFWNFTDKESEYFICLVNLARSSSQKLKDVLIKRIQLLKDESEHLGKKLKGDELKDIADANLYYSSWQYAAIHVLVSIPQFRSQDAIAKKLLLPPKTVHKCLNELHAMGVIEPSGDGWIASKRNIHLPKESPLVGLHHGNWHHKVAGLLQQQTPEGLHYSSVHALSKKDFERIKALILECISNVKTIIQPSPEEVLVCFLCDFFEL